MNPWKERVAAMRRRLDLDQDAMGTRLGVSREWVSKLERGHEEPSELLQVKITRIEEEIGLLKKEPSFTPGHLKKGDRTASNIGEDRDNNYTTVAPRFPSEPRSPSTLADVQSYFQQLVQAAKASDNPNAWPVIHDRLRKQFPLAEWDQIPE